MSPDANITLGLIASTVVVQNSFKCVIRFWSLKILTCRSEICWGKKILRMNYTTTDNN